MGGAVHHRPKRQRLQVGVHRDVLHGLYYGVFRVRERVLRGLYRVREWVSDSLHQLRERVSDGVLCVRERVRDAVHIRMCQLLFVRMHRLSRGMHLWLLSFSCCLTCQTSVFSRMISVVKYIGS